MNEHRENMKDDELGQVLRSLPREEAGADFTARVLARLEAGARPSPGGTLLSFPAERRRLPSWSGWLMAAAALLVVGLGLREWQHRQEVDETLRRIAELRGQYQELASELDELRRENATSRPVVYVGGTENVDFVVDLARLSEKQKDPAKDDAESRRKAQEELAKLYAAAPGRPVY
jgi:hypothetical protein